MEELDNKQIEGIKRLLSLLDPNSLTKEEFVSSFENVVSLIKKIEKQNIAEFEAIHAVIEQLGNKLKEENETKVTEASDNFKKQITAEIEKMRSEHSAIIALAEEKIKTVRNGYDADEDSVAEKVYGMIKIPTIEELKDQLPVMAEEVRDALEILPDGEKLEISAIEGLEEILEELKNRKTTVVGGGGFSIGAMQMHIIDSETPTNSGDDINFTLAQKPSPATSLKVYRGGARQRLTEDYTFSGQTITFLTPVQAGEILTVDYRI